MAGRAPPPSMLTKPSSEAAEASATLPLLTPNTDTSINNDPFEVSAAAAAASAAAAAAAAAAGGAAASEAAAAAAAARFGHLAGRR